jgi:hypothetical protein
VPEYLTFTEELFIDDEGHFNPAYILVATFRCFYVLVKFAAREDLRKKAIAQLSKRLMISRMLSLMSVCGVFDCNAAAKFLLLMSTVLEMQPDQDDEDIGRVVVYDLLQEYYCKVCRHAVLATKHHEHRQLAERGRVLATEIVRLMSVICSNVPLCTGPEVRDRPSQVAFAEICFGKLAPLNVVRSTIEMILYDPLSKFGKTLYSRGAGDPNALWQLCRQVIAELLDKCPGMKYDILEVFSQIMVAKTLKFRTTFLSAILAQSAEGAIRVQLELVLNSSARSPRPAPKLAGRIPNLTLPSGPEKLLICAKVEVVFHGQLMQVQRPNHPSPCFNFVVTNLGVYLADMTVDGYPEKPVWLCDMWHCDMTRLVKGLTPQTLHIGWVNLGRSGAVCEEYITLICHRSQDRDVLLNKLLVLSQPLEGTGGTLRNRVPCQSDKELETAMTRKGMEAAPGTYKISWVYKLVESQGTFSRQAPRVILLIIADDQLHELKPNFDFWRPPSDTEALISDMGDDLETMPAASSAPGGAGGDKDIELSEAGLIDQERNAARDCTQRDPTRKANGERAWDELLRREHSARSMGTLLESCDLDPDKQLLRLKIREGEGTFDLSTFLFFDDIERESWGRDFLHAIARARQEGQAAS